MSQGGTLRVAMWNIERGLEFDAVKAALTNDQRYFRRLPATMRGSRFNLANILEQVEALSNADIVILNEADWGVKRTNYRNIAKELATAMQMNYVFGVEFVEVDPLTLGTETLEGETSADKAQMIENLAVDKTRTLGLARNRDTQPLSFAQYSDDPFCNPGLRLVWRREGRNLQTRRRETERSKTRLRRKNHARSATRRANDVAC